MYAIYVLIEYVLLEAEIIRIKQSLPYRLLIQKWKRKALLALATGGQKLNGKV